MHREKTMFVDAQSHLHKGTRKKHILRQNSTMSIKLFGFSTFYVVFGFLTHKKEMIDQKQKLQCKNILNE